MPNMTTKMTAKLSVIILTLLASMAVSGCWGETREDEPSKFVRELTECNNCTISKPFLGGGETDKKNEKGGQHGR